MSIETEERVPLVSVIMPAYNVEPFVEEAIRSVMAQSIPDWELIVIDDGSSDRTREIIVSLAEEDQRIRFVCNPQNMGVARTRNLGLDLCRGKYIALLDSDDYWRPQMLEKLLARAEEAGADIVYCSYEIVDGSGKKLCNDFIVPESTTFEESLVRSVISCSTVLLSADLMKDHRFSTDIYHEDLVMWLQLLRAGGKARGVQEVLAAYRQRNNSRSAGKIRTAQRRWVIYRNHLRLPLWKCVIVMSRYGYYGLIKYRRVTASGGG